MAKVFGKKDRNRCRFCRGGDAVDRLQGPAVALQDGLGPGQDAQPQTYRQLRQVPAQRAPRYQAGPFPGADAVRGINDIPGSGLPRAAGDWDLRRSSCVWQRRWRHVRLMKTKVLLMTDVENLGRVGDVVEVTGGYARNYLLPRGLAAAPTVEAMRAAAKERERLEKERQVRIAALKKVADRMAGTGDHHLRRRQRGRPPLRLGLRSRHRRQAGRGRLPRPAAQPGPHGTRPARGRRARGGHAPRRRHRCRDQGDRGQERRTGCRSRRKSRTR